MSVDIIFKIVAGGVDVFIYPLVLPPTSLFLN